MNIHEFDNIHLITSSNYLSTNHHISFYENDTEYFFSMMMYFD